MKKATGVDNDITPSGVVRGASQGRPWKPWAGHHLASDRYAWPEHHTAGYIMRPGQARWSHSPLLILQSMVTSNGPSLRKVGLITLLARQSSRDVDSGSALAAPRAQEIAFINAYARTLKALSIQCRRAGPSCGHCPNQKVSLASVMSQANSTSREVRAFAAVLSAQTTQFLLQVNSTYGLTAALAPRWLHRARSPVLRRRHFILLLNLSRSRVVFSL